jgi:hypothetical protein
MVLTEAQKKQRQREASKKYYENNKDKQKEACKNWREDNKEYISETNRKWRKNNEEKIKDYRQTANGKKRLTIGNWKRNGLIETEEFLDEIYELWLTQELCNVCGIELTRTGNSSATDANMDHCHKTHKFRHIICGYCNRKDNWKKYFIL